MGAVHPAVEVRKMEPVYSNTVLTAAANAVPDKNHHLPYA